MEPSKTGILLVVKTSFSLGNSVTGNFVQLDGGRQLWEEPSSSKWWKSFKSEIVQGTTFAISRMVGGFQIYSFSLKMSDSWVLGRRWGILMGNPSQSSYCPTTLSVTPRSNWKIAQNSISTWGHHNMNLPSQNELLTFLFLLWVQESGCLFGEDCRKMVDFLCFGLSVSMASLPTMAVTKWILK